MLSATLISGSRRTITTEPLCLHNLMLSATGLNKTRAELDQIHIPSCRSVFAGDHCIRRSPSKAHPSLLGSAGCCKFRPEANSHELLPSCSAGKVEEHLHVVVSIISLCMLTGKTLLRVCHLIKQEISSVNHGQQHQIQSSHA